MKLFNPRNDDLRRIWRALPFRASLFIGSAAVAALAVTYIAAIAGF